MGGQQVRAVLGVGVADDGVGNGDLAAAVDEIGARAVAGEVVVAAGAIEAAEFLAAQVALDSAQGDAAHVPDVDPRPEHDQHVGVVQFRDGFGDVKFTNTHNVSLR